MLSTPTMSVLLAEEFALCALLKNDSTVRRAAGVMSTLLWTGYDASDRSLFTFRSRKENENEPKKNEMKIEKVVKSIKCVV